MSVNLEFDHYYAYRELTEALHALAAAYPKLMHLESLGKTEKGRDVWVAEITNTETGDYADKPAYYIDGNHHAGEVTGSMASLYAIYALLTQDTKQNKDLLDAFTFYVIPRVSPDGAEVYLTTPEHLRSLDRPYPYGDTLPGLYPEDINGDGEILSMRIPNPHGSWKTSPQDPRVMIKRQPDDRTGLFYHVVSEGKIVDYDGLDINPAPVKWGLDLNRGYPNCWFPEYRQSGAGPYPLFNAENRMLVDFVLSHPNIGSVVTNHTCGGVFVYPPGTKPSKQAENQDIDMFKIIGKMATEETGYVCCNIYDEFLSDAENFSSGAYDDWLYGHQGIPAYTSELWDLQIRAGVEGVWPHTEKDQQQKEEDYIKMCKWCDEHLPAGWFTPWTAFDHPQLGPVEIGGMRYKFVGQNCPPPYLLQEVEKINRFYLRHAAALPKLEITKAETVKTDTDTWHITVELVNSGFLPTYLTKEALNIKVDKPIEVKLTLPEDSSLIMGKMFEKIGHLEGFGGNHSGYRHGFFFVAAGKPTQKRVEWVIKGTAGQTVQVQIDSAKAGKITLPICLA